MLQTVAAWYQKIDFTSSSADGDTEERSLYRPCLTVGTGRPPRDCLSQGAVEIDDLGESIDPTSTSDPCNTLEIKRSFVIFENGLQVTGSCPIHEQKQADEPRKRRSTGEPPSILYLAR